MAATTFTAAMAITTTAQTEVVLPGAIRMLLRCTCSHDAHMCCDLPSVVCMRRAFPRYRLERFGHSVVDARAPDLHPPGLSPTHALSLDSRDACPWPCGLRGEKQALAARVNSCDGRCTWMACLLTTESLRGRVECQRVGVPVGSPRNSREHRTWKRVPCVARLLFRFVMCVRTVL